MSDDIKGRASFDESCCLCGDAGADDVIDLVVLGEEGGGAVLVGGYPAEDEEELDEWMTDAENDGTS